MKAIFLSDNLTTINQVYNSDTITKLGICNKTYTKSEVLKNPLEFSSVEFIFSTWGMPWFSTEEIEKVFPSLKAIFYAAGTVQSFAKEFLNKGIKVYSAWQMNAIPVAEYTVAQILLANKGFYPLCSLYSKGETSKELLKKDQYVGNYNAKVGIIGAGMIGRKVIELLKPFKIDVLVFDAFLNESQIEDLGGKKVTLSEMFESCNVVSNHLANNQHTVGMLNYEHFSKMQKNAVFINTGRGAQVVEDDLVKALKERPDLTAILDVTYPEPPKADHEFFTLSNCYLTPHIAGSSGREVWRMGDFMAETYNKFINNQKIDCEVTVESLKTMA